MKRNFHNILLFLILFKSSLAYEISRHVDHKFFAKNVNAGADSDAPVIITLYATSSCGVHVSWDCSTTCHENLNGFTVYWQQTSSEKNNNASQNIKTNYYEIGNLYANQNYTVWVASVKDDGEHNTDPEETSTNPGEPQKVTGVEAVSQSYSTVTVSWTKTLNRCPIKGYSVTWNGTALWDEFLNPNGNATVSEDTTSYVAAYLTPYTYYEFYVSEITTDNRLEPSDPSSVTTKERHAGPPEPVTSTTLSSSRVEINWTPPYEKNGIIRAYHISVQLLADTEDHWDITVDTDHFSYIIDGLLPCGEYAFSVDAINDVGYGQAGTSISTTDPEPPPAFTDFTYSNITSTSVNLTWEPLDTLCSVLKYTLHGVEEVLWSEGVEPFDIEFTTEDNFYLLKYLYPWSAYNLSITATTEGGTTDSISQRVVTSEDAAGPPTPVNSSAIDSHSVWVSWTSPEKKNGDISGYHISCANEQSDDCDVTTGSSVFSYLVNKLDAGVDYNFTVQAINGFGLGEGAETDSSTPPEN